MKNSKDLQEKLQAKNVHINTTWWLMKTSHYEIKAFMKEVNKGQLQPLPSALDPETMVHPEQNG